MATFVLDAMPVNAAFQRALSNGIMAERPELWSGVRFRIMDDPICYELSVILIATGMSVKYTARSRSFLQGILGVIFPQDNVRPYVAKSIQDFCSTR